MVEAVRVGTITAYDQKAASRWSRTRDEIMGGKRRQRGLTGAALEKAMLQLAATDISRGTRAAIVVFD